MGEAHIIFQACLKEDVSAKILQLELKQELY